MEKKYQIFISSTYNDLKEERRKVQDTILSMYHFPIGMEMFSAGDEEQWEIIQDTIDSSDYYVLIVGHKYGSVIERGKDKGISYTQKEFRYALKKEIPILAFLIDKNAKITTDMIERDAIKEKKLEEFKKEIKKNRMVQWWTNKEDLANKVMVALNKQMNRIPRPGWIRSDSITNEELDKTERIVMDRTNSPQYKREDAEKSKKENEKLFMTSDDGMGEIDYFERFNILKKKISEHPTNLEMNDFILKSYEQIVEWLINLGEQYERENEDIILRINKVNSVIVVFHFYKNKKLIRALKVFLESMFGKSEKSILISQNEVVSPGTASYDGVYDVKFDEGKMKLFATGSMLNSKKYVTAEEVVADIWESYIQPYL